MTAIQNDSIDEIATRLNQDGFVVARQLVSQSLIERLKSLCAGCHVESDVARRGELVYGIRNLLTNVSGLRELVSSTQPRWNR